jgi:hypothetical protein
VFGDIDGDWWMDLRILEGMGLSEKRGEEEIRCKKYLRKSRSTSSSAENVI